MITATAILLTITVFAGIRAGAFRTLGGSLLVTTIMIMLLLPVIPGIEAALDAIGIAMIAIVNVIAGAFSYALLKDADLSFVKLLHGRFAFALSNRAIKMAVVIQVA